MSSKQKRNSKGCYEHSSVEKWTIALVSGLLFFLLATPYLFDVTNSITESFMGLKLTNGVGSPNMAGVMVHAIVFILIVRLLMISN